MKNLKKDFGAVVKGLKALTRQTKKDQKEGARYLRAFMTPKSTALTGYLNKNSFLTGMRSINLRQTQ
jgi:hypothetical protein